MRDLPAAKPVTFHAPLKLYRDMKAISRRDGVTCKSLLTEALTLIVEARRGSRLRDAVTFQKRK
jgi:hypothetical protein